MAIKKKDVLYAIAIGATIGLVKATAEIIYEKWFAKKTEEDIGTKTALDIWDKFAAEQQRRTEEKFRESVEKFNKKEEELVEDFKEYCSTMRNTRDDLARTNSSKIFTEDYKEVSNEEEA